MKQEKTIEEIKKSYLMILNQIRTTQKIVEHIESNK